MAVKKWNIADFLRLSKDRPVLDVRSPGEFSHAHIPGALNLPLFSDEERKAVGTAYKQESREKAIRIGLDYFGPRMRSMVETVEDLLSNRPNPAPSKDKRVFVHCWRGGMRSGAVAWLLNLYGFQVHTLAGGYKAYRNYVLETFSRPFDLKILGGLTGSGKTDLISELASRGEKVIDLEGLACHKGSAFGRYGMPPQPTQEMFENQLATALWRCFPAQGPWEEEAKDPSQVVWLEDESQRIGNLNIPGAFWEQMRNSPIIFLEVPFEERLNYLVTEYGQFDTEKLVGSVERISKRLGGLEAKNTIAFLETGDRKEAFRILLQYYDKRYLKGLHNRNNLEALLTKVPCSTITKSNAARLSKHQPV